MNNIKNSIYPLLKLTIPLSFSGLLGSAIYFFQTLFLARLGSEVLAAGALVSWCAGVFIVVIMGILSSVNILVSHQHGANNKKEIQSIARDGFWLAVLLAIPIGLLFWNLAPIFLWLGQKQSVVLLTTPYLHAVTWQWHSFRFNHFKWLPITHVIYGL